MLVHLPLECRRKYISQLKQHCKMCLATKVECICAEIWSSGRRSCERCKESIFICGHQEEEYKIKTKRKQYDILYQEVQRCCTTAKGVVAPKLNQKTSSIYALQAMVGKTNQFLHTQLSDIIPENCQEDLNNLCAVSGLDRTTSTSSWSACQPMWVTLSPT